MSDDKKYGILTMSAAVLLTVLTLMMSDGWQGGFGFFVNLMHFVRFTLLENSNNIPSILGGYVEYYIDIPTKYLVFTLLCFGAYGLTTYLGVTRPFRPWQRK